jgi:sulfate adenylyltransferase (ADP) / ATP adenylyltransferase
MTSFWYFGCRRLPAIIIEPDPGGTQPVLTGTTVSGRRSRRIIRIRVPRRMVVHPQEASPVDFAAHRKPEIFAPGTLRARIQATTERALHSGALQPIPTDFLHLDDGGIRFLVRLVRRLAHKPRAPTPESSRNKGTDAATNRDLACGHAPSVVESIPFGDELSVPSVPASIARPNPFLPYEPAMYVADASPTHVCLLNKFNVVDEHLLIVTREFEEQQTPLTQQDFAALGKCLAEYEGLGFYNSGSVAGASQSHKHLQLVPLPLEPDGPSLPIAPLIDAAEIRGPAARLPSLPFPHAIARLAADPTAAGPQHAADQTWNLYRRLLAAIGVRWPAPGESFAEAYNLLVTRRWMLAVPRVRECFESISCNALTFAGALLVRHEQELELLRRHGPQAVLRHVTRAAPGGTTMGTDVGTLR